MRHRLLQAIVFAVALLALGSPSAHAATFTVTNLNSTGPGSLKETVTATNVAQGADKIVFEAGLTGTIALTHGQLVVLGDLEIQGPGSSALTVDAAGATRIFFSGTDKTVAISGMTMTRGKEEDSAGGIDNNGNLTLTDCTVSNCSAGFGGGIANDGNLTLTNCTLSGNRAELTGGGIVSFPGATVTLTNCTLSGNRVHLDVEGFNTRGGGALDSEGATVTADNCAFFGNSDDNHGGAILNVQGTMTLTRSTFSDNSAGLSGGAIDNAGGNALLINCTLSDNRTQGFPFSEGGAVVNTGSMRLILCTLSGNRANRAGGAMLCEGTVRLEHCTVSGNHADNAGGLLNFGNLTLADSTVSNNSADSFDGGGIINATSSASLTLAHCTLSANSANRAGGALDNTGSATLTLCTVFANFAAEKGGGIVNEEGAMTVQRSTIVGNGALSGAGIHNRADLTVQSTTINGNVANEGGGIFHQAGDGSPVTLTIGNSTLSRNRAFVGGGLLNQDQALMTNCTLFGNAAEQGRAIRNISGGRIKIGNTIVANSSTGASACLNDVGGFFITLGSNLDCDGSGGLTDPSDQRGTLDVPLDPKLGPLQNNGGPTQTHALLPGSPAIDKGEAAFAPAPTDQRGFARIADGDSNGTAIIDIGAFELSFFGPHDVGGILTDGFLSYSTIEAQNTYLPAGTDGFNLTLYYSPAVDPRTFVAMLNGENITRLFHPDTPDGFETVTIPLRAGENRLILRVRGKRNGKPAEDVDNLGFRVGEPPFGPR